MDIYKQNKLLIWIIAILLIGNIATVSSIWIIQSTQASKKVFTKRLIKERPTRNSRNYFIKELNLSEDQAAKYKEFKSVHFKSMHSLRDSIHQYKQSINDELFKSNPNKGYINELADSIGKLNAKFEKANYKHFLGIKSILTPEQHEKFKILINEASCKPTKKRQHRHRNKVE